MQMSPSSSFRGERGSVPSLAIFTVFVVLITIAAIQTFQSGYQRSSDAIQQRQAAATTRAVLKAIESELNNTLYSAIYASVYEAGKAGENRDGVERRVRRYLNERIWGGWDYSNFSLISVPPCDENSLRFEWQTDGSVRAVGYLAASVEHVMGARAHGIELMVSAAPRFERLRQVANLAFELALFHENLNKLESELNENYASEGLRFIIKPGPEVTVQDLWAARRVIVG